MTRLPLLLPLIAAAAASCSDDPVTPDAGVMSNACGVVAQMPAAQCTGLDQCGAGQQNLIIGKCEHCFARPDTHVCEAGTCRALDLPLGTLIKVQLQVPSFARGAMSAVLASVNPIMADGTRVTCEALLGGGCDTTDNRQMNTGNANWKRLVGGADPSVVYPIEIAADAGSDRMLVIRVTAGDQGGGVVKAQGCVGGIDVVSGMATTLESFPLAAP